MAFGTLVRSLSAVLRGGIVRAVRGFTRRYNFTNASWLECMLIATGTRVRRDYANG